MANMPGKPLTEFLSSLSDQQTLQQYNSQSVISADKFLQGLGLNAAQRKAILTRDVSAIRYQLSLEGDADEFFVPAGPTMDAPARFKAMLQGTMDPDPFPPDDFFFFFHPKPRPKDAKASKGRKGAKASKRATVAKTSRAGKARKAQAKKASKGAGRRRR